MIEPDYEKVEEGEGAEKETAAEMTATPGKSEDGETEVLESDHSQDRKQTGKSAIMPPLEKVPEKQKNCFNNSCITFFANCIRNIYLAFWSKYNFILFTSDRLSNINQHFINFSI